jgi:hypothetical protein
VFKSKLITPDFGAIGDQSGPFGRILLILLIGFLLVFGALFVFRDKDETGPKAKRARPEAGFP